MNIQDLPTEILFYIFSYVPKFKCLWNCGQVCEKWKILAYDPKLWKKVDFSKDEEVTFTNILEAVFLGAEDIVMCYKRNVRIQNVEEHLIKRLQEEIKLQSLKLAGVDSAVLVKLLTLNTQLRDLTIEIESDEICNLVCLHKELQKLHITSGSSISPAGLESILSSCDQLQVFESPLWLSGECISIFCEFIPVSLNTITFPARIEDVHVFQTINRLKDLVELEFYHCSTISFASINKLASGLPKINKLIFRSCKINADTALQESPPNESLKILEMERVDIYFEIKKLFKCFPQIEKIAIVYHLNVLNEFCEVIPESVTQLSLIRIEDFSDVHLKNILKRCQSVVELRLKNCGRLTTAAVHSIKKLSNLKELRLCCVNFPCSDGCLCSDTEALCENVKDMKTLKKISFEIVGRKVFLKF